MIVVCVCQDNDGGYIGLRDETGVLEIANYSGDQYSFSRFDSQRGKEVKF
jgi:hypothetical protein